MKFIILLRGHIRNSFENPSLVNFLMKIKKMYEIDIYIHTWMFISSKLSWREMEDNSNIITKEQIYDYLHEIKENIKHIIIENDYQLPIIGTIDGFVGGAPKLGWKNMWYGQYRIIDYLKNNLPKYDDELIINMRFDLFDNYFSLDESNYFKKLHELYVENSFLCKNISIKNVQMKVNEFSQNIQTINEMIVSLNEKIGFMNDIKNVKYGYLEDFEHEQINTYKIIDNLKGELIPLNEILDSVNENQKILINKNPVGKILKGILFIDKNTLIGVDNFYIGNLHYMHKIISHFHNNLDEIIEKHTNIKHQESLVYYESFTL